MDNNKKNMDSVKKRTMLFIYITSSDFRINSANENIIQSIANIENWYDAVVLHWNKVPGLTIHISEYFMACDTIILLNNDTSEVYNDTTLMNLILEHHYNGKRLVSVGLGFALLANAGLLIDRTISTKENHVIQFSSKYPLLKFSSDTLHSERDNIHCFSSSVQTLQLWLSLGCEDFSRDDVSSFANSFNRVANKRDYDFKIDSTTHCSNRIEKTLIWARDNLEQIPNLDMLAEKTFMSRRNFDRNFKELYNCTPKVWLTEER